MDKADLDPILKMMRQHREHLELLQGDFHKMTTNAEIAGGFVQQVDRKRVSDRIDGSLQSYTQLWNVLQRPIVQAIERPLKAIDKGQFRVQDSRHVAGDSSTPCQGAKSGSSSDESARAKIETPESNPESSSQPSASGENEEEIDLRPQTNKGKSKVDTDKEEPPSFYLSYCRDWEKLQTRQGLNPGRCVIDTSGVYPQIWMKTSSHPNDVKL